MNKLAITLTTLCMPFSLCTMAQGEYQIPVSEADEPMQTGQYEPTWQSLETHQTPEWFQDAKFGIWAHWGPQCVEGSGDWMARGMYEEGSNAYNYHRQHYGHPSEVGFKDILPLFKAEHWNPDSLVAYYKSIGAQYFMALGNHHDNFDLWDSKYQEWNSKAIGPHKDLLDGWAKAAKKAGLPFGISFHADHAWTWYEPSRGFDMKGDKCGVKYDGWLTKEDGYKPNADGTDKWWKGLDPQKLYAQQHDFSDNTWRNNTGKLWGWENCSLPNQQYVTNFYDRTLDAINRYHPDIIYFDVTVLPFYPISDAGMKIAAHMYNSNPRGVVTGKILSEEQKKALTWDVERGAPNTIQSIPWQSCSCIGGWHYNTGIYERNGYKSAARVARLLVDIVSKNGNLLLSVPLRADGTFDEKEKAIMDEFGVWMRQNSEAIYGTRPWTKFGEGPIAEKEVKINDQGFNEGDYNKLDANDIRFTTKGLLLYAFAMGWPDADTLTIKSLALEQGPEKIRRIDLLGYGKVRFNRTADGLTIQLPAQKVNTIMPVFRIK